MIPKLAQPSRILKFWWQDRDQWPRIPLYSNFDKNLSFFRISNAILDPSFTILNVWLLHRDQKLPKPRNTNFEHNLTFSLTLNCHIVSAILNFESPITKSWSATSETPLYCFSVKSNLPSNFYRHFEFWKSNGKIVISDLENPCTLISIQTYAFLNLIFFLTFHCHIVSAILNFASLIRKS